MAARFATSAVYSGLFFFTFLGLLVGLGPLSWVEMKEDVTSTFPHYAPGYPISGWQQSISALAGFLENLSVRDSQGTHLEADEGFARLTELSFQLYSEGGSIYFLGNGASASMASHFAADMAKTGGLRALVFTDLSLLTALANDLKFEEVYAEPLRWHMKRKDMVVAISSSGNSPNIVRAVVQAKRLGGSVITISAMSENNAIRKLGDLNFYVSAKTYGLAETAHATILHYWMDLVESKMKKGI